MARVISILLPDLRGGGVERVRLVLAAEFVRLGHEVVFVLMQARGELLAEAQRDHAIVDLGCARLRGVPRALACYLRDARPDALLAGMWPLTGIAAQVGRRVAPELPIVVSEHVDFRATPSIGRAERIVLRHLGRRIYAPARKVVAVSQGVAESLGAVTGVSPERIAVIHNPVRPAAPSIPRREDRDLLRGWFDAPRRVITIGSLKRQKRYDILLRAFAEVHRETSAHLLVLGEGALRQELVALARDLGLEHTVHFPGFRSDIHAFLTQADCFALSSDWEGFGNVIVEALSAGVPVVSTDCPSGPREILADGRFGQLVDVGNAGALAAAIRQALAEPPPRAVLAARAADFDPARQAGLYLHWLLGC